MDRNSQYSAVNNRPIYPAWSFDDENNVDEDSDDERESERKKERWARRKRNTELIYAVQDSNLGEVQNLLSSGVSPMVRCQHSMATVLHIAAARGQEQILRLLVNKCLTAGDNQPLRSRDSHGRQPHHVAAANGQLRILKIILNEIDPELIDSKVECGCSEGSVREDTLDSFLHNHLEVTSMLPTITMGSTALHLASKESYIDMVDYLLSINAEVNIRDEDGLSPLDVAGIYADPTVPGTIVGAAVAATYSPETEENTDGEATPQFVPYSLLCKDETDAVPQLSAQASPSLDLEDHSLPLYKDIGRPLPLYQDVGRPLPLYQDVGRPLPIFEEHSSKKALADKTILTVTALISRGGALSDGQRVSRTTPLHRFVLKRDLEAIRSYLDSGGSISVQDGDGFTPIHLAVKHGLEEPLRLLLTADGTAVNAIDSSGMTPLHWAVECQNGKIIEILLAEKVDLRMQTKHGETVLHLAAKKKNFEIVNTLLTRTSKNVVNQRDNDGYTPLFRSVENGDVRSVELLLKDIRPRLYTVYGRDTLVHLAVKSDAISVLRVLDNRMKFERSFYDKFNASGMSSLHMAVENNSLKCLDYLLDYQKGTLNLERENQGGTVLHIAAQNGRLDAMRKILEKLTRDQVFDLVTMQGLTRQEPLILAAMHGHSECFTLLLKYGANIAARDSLDVRSLTAIDHMYLNVPNSVQIIDDLMDDFMEATDPEEREDSPEFNISMDYKFLLADKKQDGRQLGVVEAFLTSKHDRLRKTFFLHPLTESFLYYKWKQLRLFFFLVVFIFLLHLIALTSYSLCTHVYFDHVVCKYMIWECRILVVISLVPIGILEVLTFRRSLTYMADSETWVKWLVVIFSAVSIFPGPYSRSLAAVSVLVSWLHLLFLVARVQKWGLHVLMFLEVAKNVWQVVSKFGFLLFGFAFSFLILFKNEHPYEGIGETIAKVVVMMVELDYAGTFGAQDPEQDAKGLAIDIVGRLLYLGFVVLVVMVLNNLINGMCVSDIAELEKQGRSRRVEKQASFLVLFERICYRGEWKRRDVFQSHTNTTNVFPNLGRDRDTNPLPRDLRQRILLTVRNRDEVSDQERIESIAEDVRNLGEAVKEIKEILKILREP